MFRRIKIQNTTFEPISFDEDDDSKSFVIPALGSVEMSYERYFDIAKRYDLSEYGIKVRFSNSEIKRVSVKDFGAKGDGFNNDTESIQRAIDYVIDYGGGIVDIPVGIYVIDGIIIDGNVILIGESKESSMLKQTYGSFNALVMFTGAKGGMSQLSLIGNGL